MQKLTVLILALITSEIVTAQAAKWDSTYRPGIYAMKVAQFRAFPNAGSDIIFLGNSITDYTDWN